MQCLLELFGGKRLEGVGISSRLLEVGVVVVRCVCCVRCWLVAAVCDVSGFSRFGFGRVYICRSYVDRRCRWLRRARWRLARSPLLKKVGCGILEKLSVRLEPDFFASPDRLCSVLGVIAFVCFADP